MPQPEITFSIRNVKVAIFANVGQGDSGGEWTYYTATPSVSYKNKQDGTTKYGQSFSLGDMVILERLLRQAADWMQHAESLAREESQRMRRNRGRPVADTIEATDEEDDPPGDPGEEAPF
jgi:hypothetical protein